MNWSRLPVLLTAALLCIGGAWRIAVADSQWDGTALLAAGLVVLGVWIERDR